MPEHIYDIFISYSRKDTERVTRLISDLKVRLPQLNYWLDVDGIESGDQFEDKIVSAIDRSKFVLFVASDSSMESKWTSDEVRYAQNTDKKVIPVIINGTALKGWFLFRFGRIDCINADAPDQFDKLVRNLASWCHYLISDPNASSKVTPQNTTFSSDVKAYRPATAQRETTKTVSTTGNKIYKIRLDKPGPMKLQIVKAVKETFGYNLKTAKELVDYTPSIISGQMLLDEEEFQRLKVYFDYLGATISKIPTVATQTEPQYHALFLDIVGPSKLATVKAIKDYFGFDLKTAKNLVDSAPCILVNYKDRRFSQSDISRINNILKPFGSKVSGI